MHIYTSDSGKELPSVTTITHIFTENDKLLKWANWLGFKRISYDSELDKTAKFGTLVHSHLQSIVDPNNSNTIKPENPFDQMDLDYVLRLFKKYISTMEYKTIFTEKTIISDELGYGGTLDWLCEIDNKTVLIDFKTSKKPRVNMLLQLGGYYNLLNTIGYDPDIGAILTVNTKGCKLHPICKNELITYSDIFTTLYQFYIKLYNKKDICKFDYDILG